jgi:hypothetical protein
MSDYMNIRPPVQTYTNQDAGPNSDVPDPIVPHDAAVGCHVTYRMELRQIAIDDPRRYRWQA